MPQTSFVNLLIVAAVAVLAPLSSVCRCHSRLKLEAIGYDLLVPVFSAV